MRILQQINESDAEYLSKPVPYGDLEDLNDNKEETIENLKKVENFMILIAKSEQWVWLSCNQLEIPMRAFVMNTDKVKKLFVHPELIEWLGWIKLSTEWCLSRKTLWPKVVRRYEKVKVSYLDSWLNEITETLRWLEARVFQHELDHLNWILI